jgi:hypothetical protein
MTISLFASFSFPFLHKPLVIAGKAMEHYGLRLAGNDLDLVVHPEDFQQLHFQHPEGFFVNAAGDRGIKVDAFEFYLSQFGIEYHFLKENALEQKDHLVRVSRHCCLLRI